MNVIITHRYVLAIVLCTTLFLVVPVLPVSAAQNDADHSEEMSSTDNIATMQTLIAILQQLVELLSQQVEMQDTDMHDYDIHMHEDMEFSINVEVHSGRTHVHVNNEDGSEDTFFLEDLDISEEGAIIDAIAEQTGLTTNEVEGAVIFDEPEEDHEHESADLTGIHIMSDGTVMLGNGEILSDATITDDGMIMLADGDLVEPEFDLR